MPLVPWTGWGNTDARNNAACPRCKAAPGQTCRTPNGHAYPDIHTERLKEFNRLFPEYRKQGVNSAGPLTLPARNDTP